MAACLPACLQTQQMLVNSQANFPHLDPNAALQAEANRQPGREAATGEGSAGVARTVVDAVKVRGENN